MLVDSHCHIPLLELEQCGGSVDAVIDDAKANDVSHLLCVSVDLESYPGVLEVAHNYDNVFASVGIHPNTETDDEADAQRLIEMAADEDVVAIGETGLDYFRSEGDLEWQRDRFRYHIEAAKQSGKPLIIHSRETNGDTTKVLREEGADSIGGVMHCFVDDWETAQQALDLNFMISFSGIVTFKNAKQVQDVASKVPLDRMLVETDCPYLAPMPHRGKHNRPAWVRHTAEFIADLRGTSYETIAEATTENFFTLFSSARRS